MLVSLHLHVQFIGPLFNLPKEKKKQKNNKLNSLYCIAQASNLKFQVMENFRSFTS